MKSLIIGIITLYQKTLSPDHGFARIFFPAGMCRFYPSCSEYTKQRVAQLGVRRGLLLGVGQLLRCHPFSHMPNHNH